MDCIFCAIVQGRAPAHVVFEDEATMAFMDINPVNPGHILVVPKAHARNIYDLDEEAAAAVMRTTVRVARAIKAALQPDGMNLLQSNERAASQVVFHFHMHIVPRWRGDGLFIPRHPKPQARGNIQDTADRIRAQLARGD
ncbi:MAG: HIT family protein [Anaerolineae bacterium]